MVAVIHQRFHAPGGPALSAKIGVVSGVYPSAARPAYGSFVEAFLGCLQSAGANLEVVAPRSYLSLARDWPAARRVERWPVLRPAYLSYSTRLFPHRHIGAKWTLRSFRRAVLAGLADLGMPPDFIYAHFWGAGWAAADWARRRRTPCIAVLGESGLAGYYDRVLGPGQFAAGLRGFAGVVASSKDNYDACLVACPEIGGRLIHLPNAVDLQVFRPVPRAEARHSLGLPPATPLVLFCGHFIERKGPLRLLAALGQVGEGVRGVFLGQGPQWPRGSGVLRAGPVGPRDVPLWLSACDVFALPSLEEGMSNAILEAMACRVPLVVSDRNFNRAFLDESCAVFTDPEDSGSIAAGLLTVFREPEAAARRAEEAFRRVARFSTAAKARAFLQFGREIVTAWQTASPSRNP